jgi:hypothetical protein
MEIMRAAQRHHQGEARVIPILLRPCHWKGSAFADLAVLPSDHTFISEANKKDRIYLEVSNAVKQMIEDWIATR